MSKEYSDQERYWLWLSSIDGIGPKRFYQLLTQFEDPQNLWDCLPQYKDTPSLKYIPAVTQAKMLQTRSEAYIDNLLEALNRSGVTAVTRVSDAYPPMLTCIYDPPTTLYVRGSCGLSDDRMMAIVGSRRCTRDGSRASKEFARGMACENVTIVSGMARGIDTYAHEGALEGQGKTIAVLGCGVDVCYPPENDKLLFSILDKGGAVISEYVLGTRPLAGNFPARNRIISGLTSGTLLVEGEHNSGAMITVNYALDQGRDVFAIPGSIYSPLSNAPNQAIVDGAVPVLSHWDILEHYHWAERPNVVKQGNSHKVVISQEELKLVIPLSEQSLSFEELYIKTGMLPSRISALMTTLELRSVVTRMPGDMFRCYLQQGDYIIR